MGSDETVPEALRQQQADGLGGDLGALAGGGWMEAVRTGW